LTVSDTADHIAGAEPLLITSTGDAPFVCATGAGHRAGKTVVLAPDVAERAGLKQGSPVAVSPLRKGQ
ncbi:MAG: hypothetical protein AAGA69_02585, partial [Pseudomonadota bacterium]